MLLWHIYTHARHCVPFVSMFSKSEAPFRSMSQPTAAGPTPKKSRCRAKLESFRHSPGCCCCCSCCIYTYTTSRSLCTRVCEIRRNSSKHVPINRRRSYPKEEQAPSEARGLSALPAAANQYGSLLGLPIGFLSTALFQAPRRATPASTWLSCASCTKDLSSALAQEMLSQQPAANTQSKWFQNVFFRGQFFGL